MSYDLKLFKGDLLIGPNGDLQIVQDTAKLQQDILKILTTRLGSNPFWPWYGSPIEQSLIGNAYEIDFISSIASSQLRAALETMMNLQKDQLKSQQTVTPQEQIAAIQNVTVDRDLSDPRVYKVLVTVLTKAFQRVSTTFAIEP